MSQIIYEVVISEVITHRAPANLAATNTAYCAASHARARTFKFRPDQSATSWSPDSQQLTNAAHFIVSSMTSLIT